ncbi:hypothetical protein GCM10023350_35830 [Nocardioides endophyticus]|uniref:Bacterial Ig-like domain-containing protein n=1 Tax=Nocardioides endophyticus TaxID=1353775 RepID=A0ABP8Z698_9ACTN
MSRGRSLLTAYGAALLLVLTTLFAVSPARAAGPTGTLTIHVVDAAGQPLSGAVGVYDSTPGESQGLGTKASTFEFNLPPGSYAVYSMSTWGGLVCRGLVTCDNTTGVVTATHPLDPATALTVTEGGNTEHTLQAAVPATVTGSPSVGGKLKVALSEPVQNLVAMLNNFGLGGAVEYQWLRDGEATGVGTATYSPRVIDAGHTLSVQLQMTGLMTFQLGQGWGGDIGPRTLPVGTVGRVPTTARATLNRSPIRANQRAALRIDVTGATEIVTGKVTATVGRRTWRLTLRNGSARLRVPKLKKGTYVVRAVFAGDSSYLPSTAPPRKLVVKPVKRKPRSR